MLCSTLFPELNNEWAGLPLALKATIISQGLTITCAHRLRDKAGEIHWDKFLSWFICVLKISGSKCVLFGHVCARTCCF